MRAGITAALIGVALAVGAEARADDRTTVIGYTGAFLLTDELGGGAPAAMHGAQLSWERGAAPMPPRPGHVLRWSLVPEVMAGQWIASAAGRDDRVAVGLVGGRVQLDFTQREMGLLRVSGYGGLYLAARAGARSDGLALGSGVLGTFLQLGDTPVRVGFEVGAIAWQHRAELQPITGTVARTAAAEEVIVGCDIGLHVALRL